MSDTVVSLCDITGLMVQPWVEAGYQAVLVDPKHLMTHEDGPVLKFAGTVDEAVPMLGELIRAGRVAAVFGFPPCTHFASSGAQHFERKMADPLWEKYVGPDMWPDALRVVWQCESIGRLSGAPWFVENPVGILSTRFWRAPDHYFDPCDYTAWEPADNYTKRTCLWTGGGFVMPQPWRDASLGDPDDRIHKAGPGPDRENFRSVTPLGFARAVFDANADKEAAA